MQKLNAGDPETQSTDLTAENIARLREIFPEAFTEGRIDFEVLKQLLGNSLDEREEKYGLNWHGKRRARQIALTPSTGTLRPCPEESVDWDTTQNLMIEGDNLEVLKLLQKSYAGKVKLIYIDPPYNTGKDFVYPDNFQDNIKNYLEITGQVDGVGQKTTSNTESSGRFHTDWLNMMYPRLRLARSLLRNDGMICISLDDTELASCVAIVNELFGEENALAIVVWQKVFAPKPAAAKFSTSHDYLVVCARDADIWDRKLLPRTSDQNDRYENVDNDPRGVWASDNLLRNEHRDNSVYEIKSPIGKVWKPKPGTSWRHPPDEMERLIANNEIWFGTDGDGMPRRKKFLTDVQQGLVPETLWLHKDVGHTQEAKREILSLFDADVFSTPKPVRLLQRVLQISTADDDLVLDFFAGSGSFGHAVLAQNASDGGRRRFILVQLPEKLDCDDKDQKTAAEFCSDLGKPGSIAEITKERIRRVTSRIRSESPLFSGDLGFRVFKLDQSNIRAWEPNRDDLSGTLLDSIEHIRPDRSEQDILFELLLKLGLDLTVPIESKSIAGKTVHSIGVGTLLVCLDPQITRKDTEPLALGIVKWWQQLAPTDDDKQARETRLVFRDSAFADDVAKTNLTAILEQHGLTNVRSL